MYFQTFPERKLTRIGIKLRITDKDHGAVVRGGVLRFHSMPQLAIRHAQVGQFRKGLVNIVVLKLKGT